MTGLLLESAEVAALPEEERGPLERERALRKEAEAALEALRETAALRAQRLELAAQGAEAATQHERAGSSSRERQRPETGEVPLRFSRCTPVL